MTKLRKAAEALIPILDCWKMTYPPCSGADWDKVEALRTALAQPEQEPVAWGIANTRPTEKNPLMMVMLDEPAPSHLVVPLYAQPVDTVNTLQECVEDEEILDVLIRSRAAISAIRTDAGHPIKGSILMADTNEYLIDVLDKTIEKALKKS